MPCGEHTLVVQRGCVFMEILVHTPFSRHLERGSFMQVLPAITEQHRPISATMTCLTAKGDWGLLPRRLRSRVALAAAAPALCILSTTWAASQSVAAATST